MTDSTPPRAERRNLAAALASGGVVAQVAGFALDAWLHGRDSSLASRESVFTLDNPGHVLVGVGLLLVVAGLALYWAGARAVPVVLVLAVATAFALPAVDEPHRHAGTDSAGGTRDPAVEDARARAAKVIPGLVHAHERPPAPQPMDAATREALAAELVEARAVALRYPTVADAEAAGYRMVVPYVPLIGAHYLRAEFMLGPFAVDRPAMVLYDGTRPDSRVVGLSYYVTSSAEPAGFAGGDDRWHRHVGLCLDSRFVVVGGEGLSEDQCRALGGRKVGGVNGWMVHAWVVPGWESPEGVFSAEHRSLL